MLASSGRAKKNSKGSQDKYIYIYGPNIFGIDKFLILNEICNFSLKKLKIKKAYIKEIYLFIYKNMYFKYVLI